MKANMATYEDLVKCGYLEMKLPRKQRKMAHKAWKRKWFVLRRKSKYGLTRLEYYHSEKACVDGKHKTVIPLCGVRNINHVHSRTHRYAFQIAAHEIKIFLSGDNELDTQEWVRLMKELVLPEPKMFPSVQGGDIYGLYEVSVIRTEDSERIGLTGDYLITVRKEYLCLHSTKTGTKVMEWELEHLPRFRLQRLSQLQDIDKVLVIMAGKGCKSGEGEFHFLSRQGREILESIKCQTQRLFSARRINLHRETARMRRPSIDSVPLTRSSGNETGDSLTSASCYDTESRERSISMSSHPSSQSGQQSSGQQSSGPQSSSPQSSGPQSSGPQSSGPQSSGPQSSGPQSSGPQSSGPQSSGQQSSGPQSSGQQSSCPQSSGQQSSCPQSSGQQSSCPQSSGQQSSCPQSSGQQSSCPQSSGQQSSCPQSSGQQSSCPQSSGQQSSCPQSSGQQSSDKQSPRQQEPSDIVLAQPLPRQPSKEAISSEVPTMQLPRQRLLKPYKTCASELASAQQLPRQRSLEQTNIPVALHSSLS